MVAGSNVQMSNDMYLDNYTLGAPMGSWCCARVIVLFVHPSKSSDVKCDCEIRTFPDVIFLFGKTSKYLFSGRKEYQFLIDMSVCFVAEKRFESRVRCWSMSIRPQRRSKNNKLLIEATQRLSRKHSWERAGGGLLPPQWIGELFHARKAGFPTISMINRQITNSLLH